MKDKSIAFVGLGNVGSKLALNILKGKYKLFVFDLDKRKSNKLIKKGAIWNNSIQELLKNCTIIITCLPSPKSVSNFVENKEGLLKYITKKHLWIEMSTTDENEIKRLSKFIYQKGAEILESPVTGGQHTAISGNISILVGGKRKNFNRAFPLLSLMGYKILYCGKLGNASTLKVVTNYLASINLLSLGEALILCKKYGLDLKKAYQGIKISSGNSFVHETESKVILNGSYNVSFTMDLVLKDVKLFEKLLKKLNIKTDLSPIVTKVFKRGIKKYGNRSFSTSIVKLLEEKSNTNLRSRGFPSLLKDNLPKKKGYEIKL